MSGLTTLPTKTDGSLGRVKSDLPDSDPSPDLDYYVPAAEHEKIKDAIVALGEEVGLHDGSTAGSLVERVETLEPLVFAYLLVSGTSATLPDSNVVVERRGTGSGATTTLTLPTPVAGRTVIIFEANAVSTGETTTVSPHGSEKIDGVAASKVLFGSNDLTISSYARLRPVWLLVSDGTDWLTSSIGQTVAHYQRAAADPTNTEDQTLGYGLGSTWVGLYNRLFLRAGAYGLGDDEWVRVDGITSTTPTSSPVTMSHRDSQLYIDTTSTAYVITARVPHAAYDGLQCVVTKKNAGTNKISLSFVSATSVNGGAGVTSYDLPGSDTADQGQWRIAYTSTGVWVSGGPGLT